MLYTRISRGQNLGLFFFFFWVLCVRMIFILSKYAVFVVIRICVIMMYRLRYYVCGCRWCLGWVIKSLGTLRSLPRVRVGCFRLLEWSRQARLIYASQVRTLAAQDRTWQVHDQTWTAQVRTHTARIEPDQFLQPVLATCFISFWVIG
jgi:hypothetical protein